MTKRRRKYTQEFKEEAVKLVLEHGYKISEAARNLGIHPNLLGRWKREIEVENPTNDITASSANLGAELNRLRKENKQLKLEKIIAEECMKQSPLFLMMAFDAVPTEKKREAFL